jgi:hypothetical protein
VNGWVAVSERLPEPGCWVYVAKDKANPRKGRWAAVAVLVSGERGTGFKLAAGRTFYAHDWPRVGLTHWHPTVAAGSEHPTPPPREQLTPAPGPKQGGMHAPG